MSDNKKVQLNVLVNSEVKSDIEKKSLFLGYNLTTVIESLVDKLELEVQETKNLVRSFLNGEQTRMTIETLDRLFGIKFKDEVPNYSEFNADEEVSLILEDTFSWHCCLIYAETDGGCCTANVTPSYPRMFHLTGLFQVNHCDWIEDFPILVNHIKRGSMLSDHKSENN